ncbi:NAD-dependent deacylase [Martelella endophytica]|uniref:NAD-dependent protein deacylase n=1 Tax=Martelella endophytica TaxID=1486262 RepID=A0A0D5LL89_MAREN|nr:NAD-dependent deacylase [Martelella endophytica]AJY44735.1 NAD-dependent deacetylase [Martelella endophytica]
MPISAHPSIVVLTGAGISAESGLATFRDQGGLWEGHSIEDVATPEGFARNPDLVNDFYNQRRREAKLARPNSAHNALAALENAWDGDFLLVTQNVDELHEKAGSKRVLHMHGRLNSALCYECGSHQHWEDDLDQGCFCQSCTRASLRPDIVWFGEMPYDMDAIGTALGGADLFISIGTSGTVYPAAGFVAEAAHHGARTVEINLESTHNPLFSDCRQGSASAMVPAFVRELLEAHR